MRVFFSFLATCFTAISLAQKPVLVIPRGHAAEVSLFAVSPDSKMIASASQDGTIRLWDIAMGRELKTLGNLPFFIESITFSPDGKKLVTGCSEELYIHDISLNGKLIYKKAIHTDYINAVAFSPNGKLLATTSRIEKRVDGEHFFEIKIWNAATMTLLKRVEVKDNSNAIIRKNIVSMRFENDNELLGIDEKRILHINVTNGTITTTEQFEDKITQLSPDGKWIAREWFDLGPVRDFYDVIANPENDYKKHAVLDIIDRQTKQIVKTFEGGTTNFQAVAFSPDSRYVVATTSDAAYSIYDLSSMEQSGNFSEQFTVKGSYAKGLVFTPDGKKLVSGNWDKIIRIWNFEDHKLLQKLGGVANIIYNVALTPGGKTLAVMGNPTTGSGGYIQLLDLKRGAVTNRYNADTLGKGLQYSPDGKYLVARSFGKGLSVWDAATSQKLDAFSSDNAAAAFAISQDSKLIITATHNEANNTSALLVLDLPSGKIRHNFSFEGYISVFFFNWDNLSVYAGFSKNSKAIKIDIETGKILQTYTHVNTEGSSDGISKLVLNKEGTILIASNYFSNVCWWNTATAKEIGTTKIQGEEKINDMIMLPGANQIISCSGEKAIDDSTITVTDILTKKVTRTLNGHDGSPKSLAVTDDGRFLFSGSTDRTVRLWDLKTGRSLATIIFFGGTDWVIVDKDGRFDGTNEGMKKMYYIKGLAALPLESGYEQFYTPNLLPRILEGENFTPPSIDVDALKAVPIVKMSLVTPQRNLSVENDVPAYQNTTGIAEISITATAPDDAVEEIRLFHNGKIVTRSTRNLLVADDDRSNSTTKKYSITLQPGQNTFRAVALNTQRTESKPDQMAVMYNAGNANSNAIKPIINDINGTPVDAVDKNATLHLIVVGINQYENKGLSLNYALADATSFKEEVEKDAKSIISNIKTYFVTDNAADKNGITNAFKQVQQNAKPQDVFIFYYAGHGVIGKDKEFYLVPKDVSDLKNVQTELEQKAIASKMLQQYAIDIQAQKQLFILDACQSAGAFSSMLAASGDQQKNIAVVARSTGTHWIAASGAKQYANEFASLGHGVFTYVLLQALQGEAVNNKMITVNNLKTFLQLQVPALMIKYNGAEQYPASYGFGNDFPVEVLK